MKKTASYLLGFWTKILKISNLKSIFKPIRKFSRLTPNIKKITLGALKVCQVSRNLRNIFCSSFIIHHSSSSFITRGSGVVVRGRLAVHRLAVHTASADTLRFEAWHFASFVVSLWRLPHCFSPHGFDAYGFSTERARVAGSYFQVKVPATCWDFRSWFQKKCLLPAVIFISPPPILKLEVGFFSDRKSFSQNG